MMKKDKILTVYNMKNIKKNTERQYSHFKRNYLQIYIGLRCNDHSQ